LARRAEFTNADFTAKTSDPLLFPRRQGAEREVEVRWWNMLFGRKDEEMNVPRALAPPERSTLEARSVSLAATEILDSGSNIRISTSTIPPSVLSLMNDPSSDYATEASTQVVTNQAGVSDSKPADTSKRPPMPSQDTDVDVLARYAGVPSSSSTSREQAEVQQPELEPEKAQHVQQSVGDPLGVSSEEVQQRPQQQQQQRSGGMDFAGFAQHNAFRDA
jgi:myotubularin-related protein 6/7/8